MPLKFIFFFFLFWSFVGHAQRYSFVEFNTAKGLPQSQVTSIAQEKAGFLWIGTLGGLAKFNGKEFQSFSSDDGLFNNKITHLALLQNQLWIGHEGGVSIKIAKGFKKIGLGPNAISSQVTAIVSFNGDQIIATNGAGLYRLKNNKTTALPFKVTDGDRVRDIVKQDDTYLIGTRSGIYRTKNFLQFELIPKTKNFSISDLYIHNNQLYACAYQDGLLQIDLNNNQLDSIPLPTDYAPRSIEKMTDGTIWLSSNNGLILYKNKRWQSISSNNGLPINDIRCLFEDDEKNIWLGSLGKGLIYFPGDAFIYYNVASGMASDLVLNINQHKSGKYFIGTYDHGLLRFNGQFQTISEENPTIWSSALSVNNCDWFGSETGLICIDSKGKKKILTIEDGLLADKTTCLLKMNDQQMLVGGSGGLQLYAAGKWINLHQNEKRDIGTIRQVLYYKKQLYIAADKGLFILKSKTLTNVSKFGKTTYTLAQDGTYLWIGTEEGLFKYDGQKIKPEIFTDMPSGRFINFVDYGRGKLFIGTNNGLYIREEKKAKVNYRHYGIQDGVINLETNLNSGFLDRYGNYWFGTAAGLIKMQKTNMDKKNFRPRLVLKEVLLNYQPFSFLDQTNVEFAANKNNLSFNFEGISLSRPEDLRFQYWLEGAEESWSPSSTNSSVVFTGLSSGEYRLHTRAVNINGLSSEEIILPFTILPPFYRTWWFITLIIILLGGLIYGYILFRIRREREINLREKIEFKSKLLALEQQSLNASMNRHFIFNSLNSIQYFINTQDKLSANRFLTNFAQLIRKNLDSAGNEGNLIPLTKELERLKLYLSLENMRFKDRFEYFFVIDDIDTDEIFIPAMLLQPFVENSIIHGILPNENLKGRIDIRIKKFDELIEFIIEDNGIGISNSLNKKVNVQGDHRSQGMEITAKRVDLIKKLSDQTFEIIGPKDRLDENHKINGTYVLLKMPINIFDNMK